ncbi:MAG: peptidoglycan editing factor PgeF, partial [Alphaproteobacteria bacterium]
MTPLTHPALATRPDVRHGFFSRLGGVSQGIYASLNCGVGSRDDSALVAENRRRVTQVLAVDDRALTTPYQVHGTQAVYAARAWSPADRPEADAVVTDQPGVALAVGTADCGPVLMCDAKAGVIAAAHAGWRGARSGILEATIELMETHGARRGDIAAVLGPTISQVNYEVGDDFRAAFDQPGDDHWFRPSKREGHAMFDLPGYIVARLERTAIGQADALNLCTYADAERFYSY